jgi:hypothetical protein
MNIVETNLKIIILIMALFFLIMSVYSQEIEPLITVDFDYDNNLNPTDMDNIYVIWLENSEGVIQNLYVCEKLIKEDLTDQKLVLPFWHLTRYHRFAKGEINTVTGATQNNQDFTLSQPIDIERIGTDFTLYMEIDQSFQTNDWFSDTWKDQPAVLYAVHIDLSDKIMEYDLSPLGWTPMYETRVGGVKREVGILIDEMRFITHHRIDDTPTFGNKDPKNSAIRSVGSIKATIKNNEEL